MTRMVGRLGLKPRILMLTSGFFRMLKIRDSTMARICPVTVAMAAPLMPRAGKPQRPNIMTGSRMILVMAPAPWEYIL